MEYIQIDSEARTITFAGTYKPTAGPLPTLVYNLKGLWTYEDKVVAAVFSAGRLPTHAGELILHKYEGSGVVHPGQAKYRYFTVLDLAGMITSLEHLRQAHPVTDLFWYMDREANQRLATEKYPDNPKVEVTDQLGNYPPMTLVLEPENPQPDSQGVPAT